VKFFVDTADVADIKSLAEAGFGDGVTTNPSLIAKSGRKMAEVIAEICALTSGHVSAEVTATDTAGMLAEGRYLRDIAPNVCIKVPLTEAGLITCRTLGAMSRR
jgi:transaldolase